MSVPSFTTPTFTFTFTEQGLDLTQARNVYVTFRSSRGYAFTKTGESLTVEAQQVTVTLNQEDTSGFNTGNIEMQVNWTTPDGGRAASEVVTYDISKQLLQRVIE